MTARPDMRQFQTAKATPATVQDRLHMVAVRYERCHPEDTFADLCNRASFSKEDRRLLEDWMAAAGADVDAMAIRAERRHET